MSYQCVPVQQLQLCCQTDHIHTARGASMSSSHHWETAQGGITSVGPNYMHVCMVPKLKTNRADTNLCQCVTWWDSLFDLLHSLWYPACSGKQQSHSQLCGGVSQDIWSVSHSDASVVNGKRRHEIMPTAILWVPVLCDLPFLDFIKNQVVKSHWQGADDFQVWA